MNMNKKGIVLLLLGLAIIVLSEIAGSIRLYQMGYYNYKIILTILPVILMIIGIVFIINNKSSVNKNSDSNEETNTEDLSKSNNINKVSRISLMGGLIGALTTNPKTALENEIYRNNQKGWKAIHIKNHSTTNLFIWLLQLIVLLLTFGLFSWGGGYLVLFEKESNC
ncbi:MAG: hypothetical protein KKD44_01225 [Proteobacteria bacterium]|nr:hypothetical protein [Pseudomonadota bacterium]